MMFIWETLTSWLDVLWQSLGLSGKQGSVVLLGLDNAGKTTLLHRIRTGRVQQHAFPPTDRPTAYSTANNSTNRFRYQGVALAAWDLGGHEVVRHLWADYVDAAQQQTQTHTATGGGRSQLAILFLIDANDHERIEEAGYELDNLIHESLLHDHDDDKNAYNGIGESSSSPSRSSVPPVAIFLNKCDMDGAASTDDICQRIDWNALQQAYPPDKIKIFRGSVWQEQGYPQAFQWMASFF